MSKFSIVEEVRNKYIDEYLESSKKLNYTQLTEEMGVSTVFYDELPQKVMRGYPTASDMVAPNGKAYSMSELETLSEEERKKCRLRYYYMPYSHELYIGTTGSGKTTVCVEPQLRAISSQKNKPNLFITDPKGELFQRNAKHLKTMGYKLFVLNFKDLTRTDKWNPLLEVYDKKMSLTRIGEGATEHYCDVPEDLELAADISEFDGYYIEYKGKAFPDDTVLDLALRKEADDIEITVDYLINSLASMFIKVQSNNDKSWEYGAQDLLKGILHCMLEDAVDPKSGFTRDMMTIRTMHRYYLALKMPIQANDCSLFSHKLLRNKSRETLALLSSALHNAGNTMKSYTGVFDGAIKDWIQGHIFSLTTGQTVDIADLEQPFAFFLITRDYDKSDNLVAGLAIDWVYRTMLEKAESGKTKRALHFLLDEFGNIPMIKDFDNKISTARSRNMWFHLFVQSYQQLDNTYGDKVARIIEDNCNVQVFLGSQSAASKETFSSICGKHYIPTLESKLDPSDNSITKVDVLPLSDLDLIEPGKMYVKRLRTPVFLAQYIRSYACEECGVFLRNHNGLKECTPFSWETFTSPKYTYQRLADLLDADDYDDFNI
ncbi:MAG: type IV secretory system conjugative DNA transfer family protein [Candidatus Fimimonas sp.]